MGFVLVMAESTLVHLLAAGRHKLNAASIMRTAVLGTERILQAAART